MPKTEKIIINTAPLISIVAALGDLEVLRSLYAQVLVRSQYKTRSPQTVNGFKVKAIIHRKCDRLRRAVTPSR